MPEKRIIIVVDGDGTKAGAVKWIEDAVKTMKYSDEITCQKDLREMNLTGFLTWSKKTFG